MLPIVYIVRTRHEKEIITITGVRTRQMPVSSFQLIFHFISLSTALSSHVLFGHLLRAFVGDTPFACCEHLATSTLHGVFIRVSCVGEVALFGSSL